METTLEEIITVTDTNAWILLVKYVSYGWDLIALRDAVAKLIGEETCASDNLEKLCETGTSGRRPSQVRELQARVDNPVPSIQRSGGEGEEVMTPP